MGFYFVYCVIKLICGMYILIWFDKFSVLCVNVKVNFNFYIIERMIYIYCSILNCFFKCSCFYCFVVLNYCVIIIKISKVGFIIYLIYLVFVNNINRCWKKKKKGEKKRKEWSGDMILKRIVVSEGIEMYLKELNEELIWMESVK